MGAVCTRGEDVLSSPLHTPVQRAKAAREGSSRISTGSLRSMRPGSSCGIASFAGVTMGARKQQDRFLILPNLVEGVLYCGVFDGHAEEGDIVAERAARTIARDLMKNLAWLADQSEKLELPQFEERVASAFTQTYVNFHAVLAAEYENEVANPVEKIRLAMEQSEGVELPRCLPMKGGTTATTGIIAGKYLGIAWVGDSRAVLCCVDAAGNVTAQDLTRDHNVDSKAERERAETRGGVVVGRHMVVDGADGMVQVLRSLGDVPHHHNGVLTEEPESTFLELDPAVHAFVIFASDGVWGFLSSEQAVTHVYRQLNHAPASADISKELLKICKSFETLCCQPARQRDDIVVCVLAVEGFDFGRKPAEGNS